MLWQNGIHQENIKIGSMISQNQIWTFRNVVSTCFFNPNKHENSNQMTPENIQRETVFPPFFSGKDHKKTGYNRIKVKMNTIPTYIL